MLVAALSVLLILACLTHLVTDGIAVRMLRTLPMLARLDPPPPPRWPKISAIVVACDEAETLRAALESRLADDYPAIEWIVVDDRSTDGTSEIVDELAAGDPRVRAIHIGELPAGWLGKVHALQRGVDTATGEWILFTDADVHFARGTIARAIARCEERGLDFLSVVPELTGRGPLLDVLFTSFIRSTAPGYQVRAIEDPNSRMAGGGGAFTLVRREALDRSRGLEWVRMEAADDVALAQEIKRAGARMSLAGGRDAVQLDWYRSAREVAVGLEKASFSLMGNYHLPRHLFTCGLLAFSAAAPFIAALGGGWPWLRGLGLAVIVADIATAAAANRVWGRSPLPALLIGLGDFINSLFMARAGIVAVLRGGVRWRGTLYSVEELRRGRRFHLL